MQASGQQVEKPKKLEMVTQKFTRKTSEKSGVKEPNQPDSPIMKKQQ